MPDSKNRNVNNEQVWLTPGAGVVNKISDNLWSNELFVENIKNDSSALGLFMKSRFPSSMKMSFIGGESSIPETWVSWGSKEKEIDLDYIYENSKSGLVNISNSERFSLSRSEVSKRYRSILDNSSMKISGRGIKSAVSPQNINDAVVDAIFAIHFVVERETTASISGKVSENISKTKLRNVNDIRDIVNNVKNYDITDILLFSTYIQPSPIGISRIFEVGSVLGVEESKKLISDCYKVVHSEQIDSINSSMEDLFSPGE